MPISRDEYEIGAVDIALFIVQFLRERSDHAFTEDELFNALASSPHATSRDELIRALEGLITSKKVESKNIGGIMYYRYCKKSLGFKLR